MKNFNKISQQILTVLALLFITNVNYAQVIPPISGECGYPKTDTATVITGSSATIGWSNTPYSSGYGIRIRATGSSAWSNYAVYAPTLTKVVGGLSALTNYEYQVKSYCNDSGTVSSPYTSLKYFSTLCNCAIPALVSAHSNTCDSAMIYWTGNSCAIKYRVQYRTHGSQNWILKFVDAPSVTKLLTALSANTSYEYRVRSDGNASGSIHSNWSPIQAFNTTMRLEESATTLQNGSMNIFPNPTDGQFLMTMTSVKNENATLRVIDIIGNEIMHQEIALTKGANNIDVAMLDLADGIYLVRLESLQGTTTNKLTIKK